MSKYLFSLCLVVLLGCAGPPGPGGNNGYTSLIDITRVTVPPEICASESGILVNSGIDQDRDVILDNYEITRSEVVCDGADGEDGLDAGNPDWAVSEVVDPCGDDTGGFDEVLLKYANGQFIAWLKNTGLIVLNWGQSYVTTDKQKCKFKITSTGVYEEL